MPSFKNSYIRDFCRTCLFKMNMNSSTEINPDSINLLQNDTMRKIIHINICSKTEYCIKSYPQNICRKCFIKLQEFEEFLQLAKISAEKLKKLIDQNEDLEFLTIEESSKDMYDLMLRGNLMETESVLITSPPIANQPEVESNKPDPFDKNNEVRTEDEEKKCEDQGWNQQSSIESDSDDNQISKDNPMMEENTKLPIIEKATTRLLRSRTNNTILMNSRRKRRTKRDLEDQLKRTKFKDQNLKCKRRQKGTKNNFKCEQCSHNFAHKITLDAHIRKVHEGSKRPFKCDRCDKYYTFIGGLYTHIKEVHEAETRSYECTYTNCCRTYTSFIAMQKHVRLKHTDAGGEPKKYVCEQCGATFNQTGNLKYHRRTKHPTDDEKAEKEREKERYECSICKKLFFSRYTLKYHTLQLHTNDTKFECNICGRRMAKKFMLAQHMLVHSTEKMPCEHCGKQFIRKFELDAHIRAVHLKLKPFECQYCSECFASRKTLKHHEYIHTGEKPYVCDICGQAYRQQTCLKNHRKSHGKLNNDVHPTANINSNLIKSPESTNKNQLADIGPGDSLMYDSCNLKIENS